MAHEFQQLLLNQTEDEIRIHSVVCFKKKKTTKMKNALIDYQMLLRKIQNFVS